MQTCSGRKTVIMCCRAHVSRPFACSVPGLEPLMQIKQPEADLQPARPPDSGPYVLPTNSAVSCRPGTPKSDQIASATLLWRSPRTHCRCYQDLVGLPVLVRISLPGAALKAFWSIATWKVYSVGTEPFKLRGCAGVELIRPGGGALALPLELGTQLTLHLAKVTPPRPVGLVLRRCSDPCCDSVEPSDETGR